LDFFKSDRFILSTLGIAICFFILFYISYNQPEYIDYKYNGIKFKAGSLQHEEKVNIEINGKYLRKLFVKEDEFNGIIKVGDDVFNFSSMELGDYGVFSLGSNMVATFSNGLRELCIQILEPNQNGTYSFSYMNGWFISAPSENRKEAVKLSNILIQKVHKDLDIE
jgi:hypothetical protein